MARKRMQEFNIRGMCDFDQLADVLNRLLAVVDEQEDQITHLKEGLAGYVDNKTFSDKINSIIDSMDGLSTRVEALEEAIVSDVDGKMISAGDLASANYDAIQQLNRMVGECPTRTEVEVQYQNLYEIRTTNVKIQKDLGVSIKMIDDLTRAQADMSDQLSALETSVANKMDKSKLSYIESVAAKVELYDEFRRNTLNHLASLQTAADQAETSIGDHAHHLASIDQFLGDLMLRVEAAALQKDMNRVFEELRRQQEAIDKRGMKKDLDTLGGEFRLLRDEFFQAVNDLAKAELEIGKIHKALPSKATVDDVRLCVTRVHHDQVVTALGEDLDTRATNAAAEALAAEIRDLWKRMQDESERITLAVRFVDWFTNRGENYEHNMQVIDRHLKNLITPEAPGYPRPSPVLPLSRVNYSSLAPEFIQQAGQS